MNGNLFSFVFHQVSGSSSPSMAISCRYMVISDLTFCSSVSVAAVAALFPRRLPKDHFFFLGTVAVPASGSSPSSPACEGPGVGLGSDRAISVTISSSSLCGMKFGRFHMVLSVSGVKQCCFTHPPLDGVITISAFHLLQDDTLQVGCQFGIII